MEKLSKRATAAWEADNHDMPKFCSEHVLIALTTYGGAGRILAKHGITEEVIRAEIKEMFKSNEAV